MVISNLSTSPTPFSVETMPRMVLLIISLGKYLIGTSALFRFILTSPSLSIESSRLSISPVSFRLAMTVVQGMNLLNKAIVLLLLSGADYLTVFEPDQLHALAMLFLNAYEYGALVWGTFFGFHLLVLGYLIFKSGYFPRFLGVLFVFASLGYLVDSYGHILLPQYTDIYTWVVLATIPAELAFAFWLLIKGVNVEKWEERARKSA